MQSKSFRKTSCSFKHYALIASLFAVFYYGSAAQAMDKDEELPLNKILRTIQTSHEAARHSPAKSIKNGYYNNGHFLFTQERHKEGLSEVPWEACPKCIEEANKARQIDTLYREHFNTQQKAFLATQKQDMQALKREEENILYTLNEANNRMNNLIRENTYILNMIYRLEERVDNIYSFIYGIGK